ncbi:MAG: hypothetical protein L0212_02135 [Acidobacteria bacterium]|nr:hypothetical protein [Acidobacteriota bacterium]
MPAERKRHFLHLTLLATLAASLLVWADSGPNHQVEQSPPIQLGTTGGNINDISRVFCCGGTLGSLIRVGNSDFILSNNHVLARTNAGAIGEAIIHPGLIDQEPVCSQDATDTVATLADFVPISFTRGTVNVVDAAIAVPTVNISNEILDIGRVSDSSVAASIGQAVQKSGRTTGLTTGTVELVNVTIDVAYQEQCGIGRRLTARFVNQTGISPGTFSAGGDSGSLVVEAVARNPRRVGLLFAGSSSFAFANPYSAVASAFPTSGGSGGGGGPAGGAPGRGNRGVSDEALGRALAVQQRHEARLFQIPGVVGAGVGSGNGPSEAVIVVMLRAESAEARRALPATLDGVPVRVEVTGDIVAY